MPTSSCWGSTGSSSGTGTLAPCVARTTIRSASRTSTGEDHPPPPSGPTGPQVKEEGAAVGFRQGPWEHLGEAGRGPMSERPPPCLQVGRALPDRVGGLRKVPLVPGAPPLYAGTRGASELRGHSAPPHREARGMVQAQGVNVATAQPTGAPLTLPQPREGRGVPWDHGGRYLLEGRGRIHPGP